MNRDEKQKSHKAKNIRRRNAGSRSHRLCRGLSARNFHDGICADKEGIPNISWELISSSPSYLSDRVGILPDILSTLYIILASLVIILPLGVGAAIYLNEYAASKKVVALIEYAAETLSGIPSIIYGLVGMLFFCRFLKMKISLIAGALTLSK